MTDSLKPLVPGVRHISRKWHYLDLDNAKRALEPDPLRLPLAEIHAELMSTKVFLDQLIVLHQLRLASDEQVRPNLRGDWYSFASLMEVPREHSLVEFSGAITELGRSYLLAIERDIARIRQQCSLRFLSCTPFHPSHPMGWTFQQGPWLLCYEPLCRGVYFVPSGADNAQFLEGIEFTLTYTPSMEEGALSCEVVTRVTDEGLLVAAERGAALLRAAVPVVLPFPILWAIEEARRIQEYDGKEAVSQVPV